LVAAAVCLSFPDPSQPAERAAPDSGKPVTQPQGPASKNKQGPISKPALATQPGSVVDEAAREQARENIKINRQLAEYTGDLVRLTFWLVIATLGSAFILFGATAIQAWLTRDTAKRELRAYISILAKITSLDAEDPIRAQVLISNSGKTPAYRLRVFAGIKFPEAPVEADLTGPLGSQSSNDVGPGDRTDFFVQAPRQLTEAEKSEIRAGSKAIYVYGIITYDDAFRRRQFTKFRYMMGGAVGVRGTFLAICEDGNEST